MRQIEVVAAIIVNNEKVLCMQRNTSKYDYISKKFEFPGGKMEQGESFIEALKRELDEEMKLALDVNKANFFATIKHQYPDFHITMHTYLCKVDNPVFVLNEHIDYVWLKQEDLLSIDWAEADIPIAKMLMNSNIK